MTSVIPLQISVVIAQLLLISTNLADTNNEKSNHKIFLLPKTAKPLHYKLEILPMLFPVEDVASPYYNISRFSAPGKVLIQFVCLQKTSNITLHAYKDLKIIEKIQVRDINELNILLLHIPNK